MHLLPGLSSGFHHQRPYFDGPNRPLIGRAPSIMDYMELAVGFQDIQYRLNVSHYSFKIFTMASQHKDFKDSPLKITT
jgi:hypothetical protein